MTQKLAYSIEEASAALGLGKTTVYNLINSKELKAVRVGGRTLVPVSAVRALIESGTSVTPSPKYVNSTPKKNAWTKQQEADLTEMHARGVSVEEISSVLGRSKAAVYQRLRVIRLSS
jgi:excisionase family DNA binding protein